MKKKTRLFSFLILLLLAGQTVLAQSTIHSFRKLSRPEKSWVMLHPFVAKKAFSVTQAVLKVSAEELSDKKLDGKTDGGQVDAFRHCYWMAVLSGTVSAKKAFKLGKAHERGNYLDFKKGRTEEGILPDSVSSVMDLFNNMRGLELRRTHPKATAEEMRTLVIEQILTGKLLIIRTDERGNFLDAGHQKINPDLWKGKWNIPKDLIPSIR
jgi:hypothetical protein